MFTSKIQMVANGKAALMLFRLKFEAQKNCVMRERYLCLTDKRNPLLGIQSDWSVTGIVLCSQPHSVERCSFCGFSNKILTVHFGMVDCVLKEIHGAVGQIHHGCWHGWGNDVF